MINHHHLPVVFQGFLQTPLFSSTNQWEFGTFMWPDFAVGVLNDGDVKPFFGSAFPSYSKHVLMNHISQPYIYICIYVYIYITTYNHLLMNPYFLGVSETKFTTC